MSASSTVMTSSTSVPRIRGQCSGPANNRSSGSDACTVWSPRAERGRMVRSSSHKFAAGFRAITCERVRRLGIRHGPGALAAILHIQRGGANLRALESAVAFLCQFGRDQFAQNVSNAAVGGACARKFADHYFIFGAR